MATRFDFESVFADYNWTALYPNAQGYQAKFLEFCQRFVQTSQFPNIDAEIEEFVTGGLLFNKEKTQMLGVSFRGGNFKKLGIYFRAQTFGNVMFYSMFKTVETNFWDAVRGKGKAEILGTIRGKCKNLQQWEEFLALGEFGELIFLKAMEALDPEFQKNREMLTSQLAG